MPRLIRCAEFVALRGEVGPFSTMCDMLGPDWFLAHRRASPGPLSLRQSSPYGALAGAARPCIIGARTQAPSTTRYLWPPPT
eukprot:8366716-Pyramimonas_sp.AAC.1